MTIYLVTTPDGKTSRWNEESIEMAKRNHRAILNNPNSSPEPGSVLVPSFRHSSRPGPSRTTI